MEFNHIGLFEAVRTKSEVSRENIKKAVAARVANGRTERVCLGCGKLCSIHMAAIRKGWKYCSLPCRYKNMVGSTGANAGGGAWMIGKNNVNYKHGKSAETGKRDLAKVNRWRRRVFEKDKHTCRRCGYNKGKILRAHHIKPWAKYPDNRFELINGITLCNPCHKWVHSKQNLNGEYLCK